MKIMKQTVMALTVMALMILAGCGSSPSPVPQASSSASQASPQSALGPNELDLAIRDASDYLNDNIPAGSMMVILNVQSDSTALSDYIIDELIGNAVNDRIFKVVDRQQLDLIRTEQNFQLSGEVDDNLALSIGKFFGAQTIVSGRVSQVADRYRMTIRALEVQTAQVQGQYNRNIIAGVTITALMKGSGGSGGGTQSAPAGTTGNGGSGVTGGTASGGTAPAVTANNLSGTAALNVNNVSTWNTAINTIRNGGNNQIYIINVTGNVSVPAPPNNENIFGFVSDVTVTIQGGGTLSLSVSGSLLHIVAGQTVIIKNVTLRGRSDNNSPMVRIMGGGIFRMEGNASVTSNTNSSNGGGVIIGSGTFIMQDKASVSGNKTPNGNGRPGGGVYVNSGTFVMQGNATVSGNTAYGEIGGYGSGGGGVIVASGGTFTMEGGTISGNTCNSEGGGVCIANGMFTMKGGIISGNTAKLGGGVSVRSGTFIIQGGTISGGNNAQDNGGGVYVRSGTFTKTGGTIQGSNSSLGDRNTASKQGHAVYINSSPARWRNAAAGPDDNTDGYGFWLND